ncbi:MAG TPA: NADPH-dependent F420 reductase [Nocardioidaceae bacterium]|nr:NADPH-dependent F420 reductase [Nocardioidaceae bacterium]
MSLYTIAIIGGTGPQGSGLGYRFAMAGHCVVLGSRTPERAVSVAAELAARLPSGARISGAENLKAAEAADLLVIAVPFKGHREIVGSLRSQAAGKTVVSCVNPLGFDKDGPYGLKVEEGSAAEQAADLLPEAKVVGAFHHVSAVTLLGEIDLLTHEDVLVCGDDQEAKGIVVDLAAAITGKPGIDAGRLRLARQLEPLTAVLISINKRYKVHSGVAIAGLPAYG